MSPSSGSCLRLEVLSPAISPVGNEVRKMRSSLSGFANALSEQLASISVLRCCCKLSLFISDYACYRLYRASTPAYAARRLPDCLPTSVVARRRAQASQSGLKLGICHAILLLVFTAPLQDVPLSSDNPSSEVPSPVDLRQTGVVYTIVLPVQLIYMQF